MVQFAAGLDKAANLGALAELVRAVGTERPDLVVCPEASMCDFGEADQSLAEFAEPLDGPFVQSLADLAAEVGTTIVAGFFESAAGEPGEARVHNTVVAVGPERELRAVYRKLHLYDAFGFAESDRIAPGNGPPAVFEVAGHQVGLMTCYDLRFCELSRALVDAGADVLAVPAAWVRGPLKEDHWETLLRARAIENTCYVVAAGQSGGRYCGRSMVIDPMGVVTDALGEEPGQRVGYVRTARVAAVRRYNPTLRNRRFSVVRHDADVSASSDTLDAQRGTRTRGRAQ